MNGISGMCVCVCVCVEEEEGVGMKVDKRPEEKDQYVYSSYKD